MYIIEELQMTATEKTDKENSLIIFKFSFSVF